MSNMENLQEHLSERQRQDRVFDVAMRQMRARQGTRVSAGHSVMAAAMGFGASALGSGRLATITHNAKLFCIGFAFLVPSLLVWRVLL